MTLNKKGGENAWTHFTAGNKTIIVSLNYTNL